MIARKSVTGKVANGYPIVGPHITKGSVYGVLPNLTTSQRPKQYAANSLMLETERLLLRQWKESDREPFAALNADRNVKRYFPACLSRTEIDAMVDRIQRHFDQHGFSLLAAELKETKQFIGYIGMVHVSFEAPFVPAVEIAWRLSADYWNKGLATEGARRAVDYGFRELGLDEIVAFTVPTNIPSRRVMEKLGMTHDPAEEFEHPRVPPGHPLRHHVLYRLKRQ